ATTTTRRARGESRLHFSFAITALDVGTQADLLGQASLAVHDWTMPVEAIHLGAPGKPELWTVESVQAVAGKGLEGDRHFYADGAASGQALTLVAAEVVEDVALSPGETRRQVTVRDVDVNALVGKRFRVGEVECFGVELCEPCRHLEEMTRPGI